jgi:hypothetical protein
MACWPAYAVGAFFLALLLFDMGTTQWSNLPIHSLLAVVFTLLFWALCIFVGPAVSGGILVVPAIVILIFMLSVYVTGKSITNRGYCASHGCATITLEKKAPPPPPPQPNPDCPVPPLKATPIAVVSDDDKC